MSKVTTANKARANTTALMYRITATGILTVLLFIWMPICEMLSWSFAFFCATSKVKDLDPIPGEATDDYPTVEIAENRPIAETIEDKNNGG